MAGYTKRKNNRRMFRRNRRTMRGGKNVFEPTTCGEPSKNPDDITGRVMCLETQEIRNELLHGLSLQQNAKKNIQMFEELNERAEAISVPLANAESRSDQRSMAVIMVKQASLVEDTIAALKKSGLEDEDLFEKANKVRGYTDVVLETLKKEGKISETIASFEKQHSTVSEEARKQARERLAKIPSAEERAAFWKKHQENSQKKNRNFSRKTTE
tara:strand:- start:105 stop:746 length:642 start_codon:yes stop_codon:yes gene_type:complete